MRKLFMTFLTLFVMLFTQCEIFTPEEPLPIEPKSLIIDHKATKIDSVPIIWCDSAKLKLHIAYEHTSHGSQIVDGMNGLKNWKGEAYGGLDLRDHAITGWSDLGSATWDTDTRNYLNSHPEINVVMWSWCGQVSTATPEFIDNYLSKMTALETEFPNVTFIYMTGHLDGTGEMGNLNQRNEQIRNYCKVNNKVLFDFAAIESYDPDGNYFLNRGANDNCDYDGGNWAIEWQNAHQQNTHWYSCGSAHSQPLNANLKAYAAWNMWARLAGWDGR
jgi:hypothetical protein